MKNNLRTLSTLVIFLFVVVFANAQSSKKVNMKKPESVAIAFLQRFSLFEFEKAKELLSEDSKELFAFLEMMMNSSSEEEMKKAKEDAKESVKNLKKANCVINKDEANCTFCCDENNKTVAESELKLIKVKGKWYVNMKKEEMMNEEANPDGE